MGGLGAWEEKAEVTTAPHPSDLARARARLANKVSEVVGYTMVLTTAADTLQALRELAHAIGVDIAQETDPVAKAKYQANMLTALQALERCQRMREEAGLGDEEDPDVVEQEALDFLRGRGWRCER